MTIANQDFSSSCRNFGVSLVFFECNLCVIISFDNLEIKKPRKNHESKKQPKSHHEGDTVEGKIAKIFSMTHEVFMLNQICGLLKFKLEKERVICFSCMGALGGQNRNRCHY